ncbi:MAG: hypothetical protein NTV34_05530 [Proteobacteria bacterium]|nr:hypothetical protein [Pseudomonadota bacterium]
MTKPEVVSIAGTKALSKGVLIGNILAYVPFQDTAISLQTNRPRVVFEENSGLAIAYPVDFILDGISEAEKTIKNDAKPEPAKNEQPQSP